MKQTISVILLLAFVLFAHGGDVTIYTSGTSLGTWWDSWSYGGTWSYVDSATTIQYSFDDAYGAFVLHYGLGWDFYETPTLEFQLKSTGITEMEFQIGTNKGIPLGTAARLNNFIQGTPAVFPTNSWVQVSIPLNYAGLSFNVNDKAYLFILTALQPGTLQFKNVKLAGAPFSTNIDIQIDAANLLRQINTGIYGVNFGSKDQLTRVGYTSNRKGGNAETRYNWEKDINNRAIDYFYQNVPNPVQDEKKLPRGSTSETFVTDTLAAKSIPMMQFTTIGWTALNKREKICSYDEGKYGAQQNNECRQLNNPSWCIKNCGNGVLLNGDHITFNDPTDTSMRTDQSYAVRYIQHLRSFAPVNYFFLDNEPGLWHETHIDVHPKPINYEEIWNKILTYGSAIRSAVPNVQLLGPSSWNFCEYMYSPQDGNCVEGPDFYAHGNLTFSEFLMKKMADHKTQTGVTLLDYFDIHYYPDGLFPDTRNVHDAATDARRLRSLKSLYDPRYNDETWLGMSLPSGPTQLRVIPRMRDYIATHAPWLKLSISEYNWGDTDRIVQALCQIEALAIFAREGVQMAQRFQAPASGSLIEKAFYFMMDYDGTKAKYSGNAVFAKSSNVDMLPVYSAINQQQNIFYIILINKDPSNSYTATMNISNVYLRDSARVFVLQETGFSLTSLAAPKGSIATVTVPPYSAYMIAYDINGGKAATGTTFPSYDPAIKNSANNILSATFTLAVTFLLFFFVFF